MKKVLILITKSEWSGAQRVVYEIFKEAVGSDSVELHLATGQDGILADKVRNLGFKVSILENLVHPIKPLKDIKAILELRKLVGKNKYDVVHCHSTKAGIVGRSAAFICRVPKRIFTAHGWWPILQYEGIKRKAAAFVERIMSYISTDIVFICDKDKATAKEYKIGNTCNKVKILNEITIIQEKDEDLRNLLNIDKGIKIIGNISRTDDQKNPKLFIDVANKYLKIHDDTVFVWIGNGRMYEECLDYINELNIQDKVKFIGFREDAGCFMSDFDLLFMTSKWEGVPITILEAKMYKTKILSSDVGGIKEVAGEESVYDLHMDEIEICNMIDNKMEEEVSNKTQDKSGNHMAREYIELYKIKN